MKNIIISALVAIITIGTVPAVAEAAPACTLTAAAGETIINFSGTTIFSNANPKRVHQAANVPAGTYTISAQTWDNHSAHGGQNQTAERVKFIFKDATGEIVRTGATTDIAEGQNWRTTNLGNKTLVRAATTVTAEHAAIGTGNYQSVAPICIKLVPVNTTPAPTLTASCSATPSSVTTGQNVTWDANATGGTGSYTYSWTGADTNGQTAENFTKTYSSTGSRTATVTVTSGTQTATATCAVNVTTTPTTDLGVTCRVSDTRIEEGDSVDFTADVTNGTSPFSYDWDWDIDGTNRTESYRFNRSGNYRARVTVTDNAGRTAQHVCPTVVVEQEDDDNDNDDDDDLEIQCRVSDTTIEEGDDVTFSVDIDGGNSPFDIEWDGDISGDDRSERVRFNRDGRYEVEVTVRDEDGNRDTDSCPVVRVSDEDDDNDNDDDDDNRNINVITRTNRTNLGTPTGNLASLDSVFLSQVPYTGPEDVLKALGVLAFIAIWSTGVAIYFKRRRAQRAVSLKIAAFKEANKAARS